MDNENRMFLVFLREKDQFVCRFQIDIIMADSTDNPPPPKKNLLFWSKIIATQYLIRHPFWKSFALPMIIGQVSANSQVE